MKRSSSQRDGISKRKKFSYDEGSYEEMSAAILRHFKENEQTLECYNDKKELRDVLHAMFKDIFPYLGIYIVGSSANGFGSNKSDVDMCMMVSYQEIDQKTEAFELLKIIGKALRRASFIRNLQVINAKVPIIKFRDTLNQIDCDININSHNGIRNTHMVKCYSDLDWRVRPLIVFAKHWAKLNDINDAAKMTISSYSLVLMGIFYLQSVCKPAILPVLHQMFPEKFHIRSNITNLSLNDNLTDWKSSNTQSLGELFAGFIEYYSKFDYRNNIISIRTGKLLRKTSAYDSDSSNPYSQWKYLCIEEPFELTNTARSVYDYYEFQRILRVFQRSHNCISQFRSITALLNSKINDDYY